MRPLHSRALAVALAVVLVGAGSLVVAGGLTVGTTSAEVSSPTATPTTMAADATTTADNMSVTDRLQCTNATSESILACGPTDGPADVALSAQSSNGGAVTVDAIDLNEGGFVAVHRVSFIDGNFTESVVGVSENYSAGLHRDVPVQLQESFDPDSDYRLIAIAYRDSDGDGTFDFAATNGTTDRPYTNTYTEAGGNVTDEPGDVLGDHAMISVTQVPMIGNTTPTSVDDDPLLEDIDGDGEATLFDALAYYNNRNSEAITNNPGLFDFDGDGESGTLFDAMALYNNAY